MKTTAGQVLVNAGLPKEYQDYGRSLDKKSIGQLLARVAKEHPEDYPEILRHLMDVGRSVASSKGHSVSLRHLVAGAAKRKIVGELKALNQADIDNDLLTDEQRDKRIVNRTAKYYDRLAGAVMDEARANNSPFELQVRSGGRGNAGQHASLVGADLLVSDYKNRPMPTPLYNSYSDGLDPVEYWAAAYGARKGLVDVKMATADAGFFGKQLALAAHRQVVSDESPNPSRLPVGLVVSADDPDNEGAVLAMDAGQFKAGETITAKMLEEIRKDNDKILVHSPLTSLALNGGIDRLSAGVRSSGGLAAMGENVGIAAAQAISEPVSQGSLDCLAEGTLVRMADWSVKPIEQLRPGDTVLGSDVSGNTFPVRVNHLFNQGLQPVHRWEFKRGNQNQVDVLEATSNHKILANIKKYSCSAEEDNHKVVVSRLGTKAANYHAIPAGRLVDEAGLQNDPRALALGLLLGDGGYTEAAGGIFLTCADPTQIEDTRPYFSALGLRLVQNPARDISYRVSGPRGANTSWLKDWLKEIGCWGKYAHEKEIPAEAYGWDTESIGFLLAGLFVTDGCLHLSDKGGAKASWHFASTSQRLVEQVSELLVWRYGVQPSAVTSSIVGHKRRLYQLHINRQECVRTLCRDIPLIGRKAGFAAAMRALPVSRKNLSLSVRKRVGKTYIGRRQCWDIEVDHPDHLFVLANGLVVSNSKHRSGVGGERIKRQGFEYLNRLFQSPEYFAESGPIAPLEGRVNYVEPAPQGGHFIGLGDQKIYVQPGVNPIVKSGQKVEIGDDLTDGVPHPRELVKHLGVGEARRRFLGHAMEAFGNSNLNINRRNAESVVAGLMNHMRVTNPDGVGENIIDDIVPYNRLAATYKARENSQLLELAKAKNQFLEEPVLHYSPGTRLTTRVLDELKEFGVKDVQAHPEAPDFEPHFERLMTVTSRDPDWQTQLGGFYISRSFPKAVQRGATSTTDSTSYIPALAQGADFGKTLERQGRY